MRAKALYVLIDLTYAGAAAKLQQVQDRLAHTSFMPRISLDGTKAIVQIKPSWDISRFTDLRDHPAVIGWGDREMAQNYLKANAAEWDAPID